ncbi:MAG TPA: phosphatidylserine decarboxylase [Bryobacteraceae bacterium]|nr:phosphatidylserine decarboxylase [Bryobacteraceae bacterium]
MVRDGIFYALGAFAAGLVIAWLTHALAGVPFFVFGVFCLWFFRDPEREVPSGRVAVSPADGKVMAVVEETPESTRVSIFLNIFDVHVNRTPIEGRITDVTYRRGRFLVASKEVASAANEQNSVTVEGDGTRIIFKQIAGLIARRIVFWKRVGDEVRRGERIGLMKFGSRMDVLFGPEWEITVRPRDRVLAASSVIARRRDHPQNE